MKPIRSSKPYGKIEIIEEMHPKQSDDPRAVLVKPRAVLINGHEILVAEGGITIDSGVGAPGDVTRVTIEFLPDDVHIRRVPAGYIDRANHLYELEKDQHRIADVGLLAKIRQAFKR